MFVDITDFKGAIEVENMLRAYKRGEMKITPEVCFEVLEATNYKRNIRDMLECVAQLPVAEQAGFKDVVLSTFDNREQPNEVLILGKKLAVAGGYEATLGEAAKIKDGDYLKSAVNVDKWFITAEENWYNKRLPICRKMMFIGKKPNLSVSDNLPEELDVSRCDEVALSNCNLAPFKNLRFKAGARVDLSSAWLPEDLNVSMCDEVDLGACDLAEIKNLKFKEGARVNLGGIKNLPKNLDVSMCDVVSLCASDLASVKNLRFKAGAKVNLREAKNLPEDLDVSMCDEVKLVGCDLAEIKNLKFKEGAIVNLCDANNLPEDLDVSMCDEVILSYCNLASVKNLKFKEGARVNLGGAKNLPKNLDVSICDEVGLWDCNLAGVKKLKFKAGAKVSLRKAKNLPEDLDVSMCDEVNLKECNLVPVKNLRFKDKEQMKASDVKIPNEWDGIIAFAEKEKLAASRPEAGKNERVAEKEKRTLKNSIRQWFGIGGR